MTDKPELLLTARRFQVVRQAQTAADGSIHWRETVQHPGSVAIVPLVDIDQVCLIRNYRVAVGQTLWEIPAGTLDHDEPPLDTARRELIEETGYRAESIEKLTELSMSPGILNERMHVYLATGLTPGPNARRAGRRDRDGSRLLVRSFGHDRAGRNPRRQDRRRIALLRPLPPPDAMNSDGRPAVPR